MLQRIGIRARSRQQYLILAACGAIVALPSITGAATIWIGDASGSASWFNTTNWSSGLPSTSNDAYINNGGIALVNANTTATAGNVYLGMTSSDNGSISLAGKLSFQTLVVGNSGSGNVMQTGSASGGFVYVGYTGSGTYTQSGGASQISSLDLGYQTGSTGTYSLAAGTLSTGSAVLGEFGGIATFAQSGGTHSAGSLIISPGGSYVMSGGTLTAQHGIISAGTVDLTNSQVQITVGGLTDFSAGALINSSNASISTLPASLAIFPAGFDPATQLKSLNASGMIHIGGTTLVVPAGQGFKVSTGINDPVDCSGNITGTQLTLLNGLTMRSGAMATLFEVDANNTSSLIEGGQTTAAAEIIGSFAGAICSITQTGGSNLVQDALPIGFNSSAIGTYFLSGGSLTVGGNLHVSGLGFPDPGEIVGYSGQGNFAQSGGTNTVTGPISGTYTNFLRLGYLPGSLGFYSLSAGTLSTTSTSSTIPAREIIGDGGTGHFIQSGGTNTVLNSSDPTMASLWIGNASGSSGMYELLGGTLSVGNERIGLIGDGTTAAGGVGLLHQSGGNHNVMGLLSISCGLLDYGGGTLAAGSFAMSPVASLQIDLDGNGLNPITIAGSATLDGHLRIDLWNIPLTEITSSETFTLLNAAVIDGAFENVLPGQRLLTDSSEGTFVVNYGPSSPYGSKSVVLSDFQPVPEPSLITTLLVWPLLLQRRTRMTRCC